MSKKELALWLVLADFVALTVWAVYSEGYLAFVPAAWAFASGSAWGAQIVVDFLLGLSVALGFVVADARRRGLVWWPFLALTLTLGSIGPLAYLIFRERQGAQARVGAAAPQHA
jgi:hypothetical protein